MLSCGNLTFSYGPGFLFMRYENHAKKKKKKSHSHKIWETSDLLRVLAMVMGIPDSQEGYNLKHFPNFLFTVTRGTVFGVPQNRL